MNLTQQIFCTIGLSCMVFAVLTTTCMVARTLYRNFVSKGDFDDKAIAIMCLGLALTIMLTELVYGYFWIWM